MTDPTNPAPPGREHKYARTELERRWLLSGLPQGAVVRTIDINDRYLVGPRLRLRRAFADSAGRVDFKLTQKVPAPDGGPGTITTIYLTAPQAESLLALEARTLRKRRLSIPPYGVDVFAGPLAGLMLAEVESDDPDDLASVLPPVTAVAEVTTVEAFTGGALAATSRPELERLLEAYGLSLDPPDDHEPPRRLRAV